MTAVAERFGGVETGGTWCVCALGCGPGELIAHERFPTTSPETTLDRIVEFFRAHGPPVSIGIGSFGPIDLNPDSPTWGQVTTTPKPDWQRTPVASVVQGSVGVPVVFDTDVNAAAVGEQRWGAGRGAANVCYLTVGTGIGAGFALDGRPLHGLVHPEVGHMRIPHDRHRDPFPGACPAHGDCWEGLASGVSLAQRWNVSPSDLPDDHPAWPLEAEYIALGVLSIVLVASPHRVIIGGGVLGRRSLLPLIRTRLRELVGGYLDTPLLDDEIDDYLVEPTLGDDAGVLGAIALAKMNSHGSASGAEVGNSDGSWPA